MTRPLKQHKFQENGLRRKDPTLRFVESIMANKPCPRRDFGMPPEEEETPRAQEHLPYNMNHVESSPDDSGDEPFDTWAECIVVQQPKDNLD